MLFTIECVKRYMARVGGKNVNSPGKVVLKRESHCAEFQCRFNPPAGYIYPASREAPPPPTHHCEFTFSRACVALCRAFDRIRFAAREYRPRVKIYEGASGISSHPAFSNANIDLSHSPHFYFHASLSLSTPLTFIFIHTRFYMFPPENKKWWAIMCGLRSRSVGIKI